MSLQGESFILVAIGILLLVHLGGNLLRVKKKYDFVSFLKEERQKMMTDKLSNLSDKDKVFECMPHCVFDKESNGLLDETVERYGELYRMYRYKTYYVLLRFLYKETDEKVFEQLEVSELLESEKEAFIANHTFSFKKNWEAEKQVYASKLRELQNTKSFKKKKRRK